MVKGLKKIVIITLIFFSFSIAISLTASTHLNSFNAINNSSSINHDFNNQNKEAVNKTASVQQNKNNRNSNVQHQYIAEAKTLTRKSNVTKTQIKKIAYITFDDGPSINVTPEILDILKKYNVKASFFVIGEMAKNNPGILKRATSEGHLIANHTYSHNYKYIYSSPARFIDDVKKCNSVLLSILGTSYDSKIIRFPGGSFGKKRAPFRNAITKAGYDYVDWNALNGDAESMHVPVAKLISRIKQTTLRKNEVVILMHDSNTKQTTVQALPKVLDYLKSQGYEFETLDKATKLLSSR